MRYRGTYRTKSGRSYFQFSYESRWGGQVKVFIESQPSYESRATDGHSTHRFDISSRPYICFANPPRNLDDAIKYSKTWAERTERYILTGREINAD